jgi:hypothetical protein
MAIINLSDIVEAVQMESEVMIHYLNKNTGEIVPINKEEIDKETLEEDDYIPLPSQLDIHEYEIMKKFCLSRKDQRISDDLWAAITGRGAFRQFKNKILQYGIDQSWHQYIDVAYREIAKK